MEQEQEKDVVKVNVWLRTRKKLRRLAAELGITMQEAIDITVSEKFDEVKKELAKEE